MVHALNNARRVLTGGGLVVDIRPVPDRPSISWESPDGHRIVGRLRGARKRFRTAQEKLETVVRQDLFRSHRSEVFHLMHYAVSLRSLLAYVAAEFPRSRVDGPTVRRIRNLLGPRAVGRLRIDEPARMSILNKR